MKPEKEALYTTGYRFLVARNLDSAEVYFRKVLRLDTTHIPALSGLAGICYDMAMMERQGESGRFREASEESRSCYIRLEQLGEADSDVYERLCELSVLLEDDKTFLTYAKKNAEKYPFDRQYYNLGLAYFHVADYAAVIATQKDALAKFESSPFIGSFYRQLGRAYTKVDRDQTAERTFMAGVKAVDDFVARMKKGNSGFPETPEYKRLADDKIGMLLSLRKLHHTYKDTEKLKSVEKQLQEAGYDR